MTEEGKGKDSLLSKIVLTVVIALLASSTAPWWWTEFKGLFKSADVKELKPEETLRRALDDYELVQALYQKAKGENSCNELRRLIEKIRVFEGNQRLVPESFRYSVINPEKKATPTISDLATDRMVRIKKSKPECFE